MRKGSRQSSSSSHKNNLKEGREEQQNCFKAKHNPGEEQASKELMKRSDEIQGHVPVYRVTKTKFQKNNWRYSENSPLKLKEKGSQLSPYKQQEYEAYNFGHLNPLDPHEHRKKGRSYFYKKKEDQQQQDEEVSKLSDFIKPNTVVLNQQQQTEPKDRAVLALQEMHYEMVKTYQKCKSTQHF